MLVVHRKCLCVEGISVWGVFLYVAIKRGEGSGGEGGGLRVFANVAIRGNGKLGEGEGEGGTSYFMGARGREEGATNGLELGVLHTQRPLA